MNCSLIKDIVVKTKPIFMNKIRKEDITVKGVKDLVTVYDKKVQDYIESELKKQYPGVSFIAEETGWQEADFSAPCFVLDPIDGTTNFIHGYNHSAVSLAYIENNEVVYGVVYNPYSGDLFEGEAGRGSYLNGERIFIDEKKTLSDSLIAFGTTPYERSRADAVFQSALNVFKNCLELRRGGSAALDIAYVAAGRLDGFFEMGLKLWDFAAASIIAKEAGIKMTDYQGNDIKLSYQCDIIAANPSIFNELVEKI